MIIDYLYYYKYDKIFNEKFNHYYLLYFFLIMNMMKIFNSHVETVTAKICLFS